MALQRPVFIQIPRGALTLIPKTIASKPNPSKVTLGGSGTVPETTKLSRSAEETFRSKFASAKSRLKNSRLPSELVPEALLIERLKVLAFSEGKVRQIQIPPARHIVRRSGGDGTTEAQYCKRKLTGRGTVLYVRMEMSKVTVLRPPMYLLEPRDRRVEVSRYHCCCP